jgi:5-methylcytosine-specific restriction endonuclease McrA
MSHTLILNGDYTPLSVAPLSTVNWKEAIKMVYLDQVDVMELYADWFVHSPSVTIQVPSVVVSRTYVKTSRSVKFSKMNLCIRDDFQCQYCQKKLPQKQLTMEHVMPRSRGGKTTWQNVCCACSWCNTAKANKTTWKPIKEPHKPTYGELLMKAKHMPIQIPDASWIPYLGWPPHLVSVHVPHSHNIDSEDLAA